MHRPVAIKELLPDGCARDSTTLTVQPQRLTPEQFEQIRQRFIDEARLLAQLNHPNIVRVYDVFEAHNTGYLVMEYLQGHTLAELLRQRGGVMPEQEAVDYILQICDALEVVHQRGYLHRDIKPSNIIVTDEGRAVLIDFGAAREFAAGQTRGHTVALTPAYAPLEQYGALGRFDGRTDLYALGATLYHLVSGQPPLPAPDRAQGIPLPAPHQIEPRVSESVSRAIMQALGLRMEDRPASVGAWAQALRAAIGSSGAVSTAATSTSSPVAGRRVVRVQRRGVLGVVGVVLVIGAVLGGWWWFQSAPRRLAVQALQEAQAAALKIGNVFSRAGALAAIAAAQAEAGQVEAARATFAQALQTAQQIEEASDRASALREIAVAQAKAGQAQQALRWARERVDLQDRAYALLGVAEGILAQGKKEESAQNEEE